MDYDKQLKKLKEFRKQRAEARKAVSNFLKANPEYQEIERKNAEKKAAKEAAVAQEIAQMRELLASLQVKENRDRTNAILSARLAQKAKSNPNRRLSDMEAEIQRLKTSLSGTEPQSTSQSTSQSTNKTADTGTKTGTKTGAEPGAKLDIERALQEFFSAAGTKASSEGDPADMMRTGQGARRQDPNAPRTAPIRSLSITASQSTMERRSGLADVEKSKINAQYLSDARTRAPAFAPIIGNKKAPLLILMGADSPQIFKNAVRPYAQNLKESIARLGNERSILLTDKKQLENVVASDPKALVRMTGTQLSSSAQSSGQGLGQGLGHSSGQKARTMASLSPKARKIVNQRIDRMSDLDIKGSELKHDIAVLTNRITSSPSRFDSIQKLRTEADRLKVAEEKRRAALREGIKVEEIKPDKHFVELYRLVNEIDRKSIKLQEIELAIAIEQRGIDSIMLPKSGFEAILGQTASRPASPASSQARASIPTKAEDALGLIIAKLSQVDQQIKNAQSKLSKTDLAEIDKLLVKSDITPYVTIQLLAEKYPARARRFALYSAKTSKKQAEIEKETDDIFADIMAYAEEQAGKSTSKKPESSRKNARSNPNDASFTVLTAKSLEKMIAPERNDSISYKQYVPEPYAHWFNWNAGDTVLGFADFDVFVSQKGIASGAIGPDEWQWNQAQKAALNALNLDTAAEEDRRLGFNVIDFGKDDNKKLRIIMNVISQWRKYNYNGFNNENFRYVPLSEYRINAQGKREVFEYVSLMPTNEQIAVGKTKSAALMAAIKKLVQATQATQASTGLTGIDVRDIEALLLNPLQNEVDGITPIDITILLIDSAQAASKTSKSKLPSESLQELNMIKLLLLRMKETNLGISMKIAQLLNVPSFLPALANSLNSRLSV